ncbi:TonB-dependent receptor [Maricaulis virginensis]|uniref:TonB-dependent receptor n=2 Tax=Maricaulis virginensis TaxID=144022 RepID=A0A9W6IMZ4_9PROT|nr:TonB-dependent receptor [Maricaulis virginensis]
MTMSRTTWKQELISTAASAVLAAGLATVAAQAQNDETASADVIVVTAQRREQSILDVSASVSALGAAELEERGVERLDDIASVFPNVYINTGNGLRSTIITVRGISSNPNNPGVEQSVGVFVDGVYQARPTTINTNLYDLERVEVIRGPQGALYGKNTIAGALNMITEGPGEEPGFEAVVSAGNYSALSLYAAGDVIFTPDARARVSVSSQTRSGYTDNIFTGDELDDQDELGARLTFVANPSDTLQLTFRADMATNDTNGGSSEILANGALAGTPLADADPEDRQVAQDFGTEQTRDVWGVSLQADWDFDSGVLTSLTAFRTFEWYNSNDNDFSILNQLRSGISEDHEQFSQEIRFTSDTGGVFDYIVGGFFSHETFDTISNAVIGPDLGIYPTEVSADIFGDLETTSYAVFGQGTYHFSDAVSVTGALRYSEDEKEVTHSQIGDPYQLLAPTQPERSFSRSDAEVTPSITLNWEPNATWLVYASYSRGYKSGGYNVFSIMPNDNAEYDPEFVNSYEAGVKTTLAGGAVYLAGSVFWLDYSDLQVNQLINVGGVPTFTTSNAATAEASGIELEGLWQVTGALSFSGSYSFLDASFEDFTNATSAGADYSGNDLPQAPDHTLSLAADFTTPVAEGMEFVAHADLSYRSSLFFGPENNPDYSQDDVTLVNARAGFTFQDNRWSVMLWGRNIGDEIYAVRRSAGVIIPGQQIQALGAPQTWGVELRGRF